MPEAAAESRMTLASIPSAPDNPNNGDAANAGHHSLHTQHRQQQPQSGLSPRLGRLDLARGIALIAMAIYHFGWDLEFFGYLPQGSASHGWWRIFARCIASSFLFLVGFSLVLAHGRTIRWRAFGKRFAQVAIAAMTISVLTWLLIPQGFIFFGILHQIALASLLGLLFIRLPIALNLLCAIVIIIVPVYYRFAIFDHPALWWVGLSTSNPVSNDYVPLFPWFGAVLAGIAAAQLMQRSGILPWLQGAIKPRWLNQSLSFIGRHSLIFYLVHQPLLLGFLFIASQFITPSPAIQAANFTSQCNRQCSSTNEAQLCLIYCDCMLQKIESQQPQSLRPNSEASSSERQQLEEFSAQCIAQGITQGLTQGQQTPAPAQ